MHHSSSGKSGHDLLKEGTDLTIDEDVMYKILTKENELRLSKEIQDLYSESDSNENFKKITDNLQIEALKEFGFDEKYLVVLRNARYDYKRNPKFTDITVYFKYDISKRGNMTVGSLAFNCDLYTLEGKKKMFI